MAKSSGLLPIFLPLLVCALITLSLTSTEALKPKVARLQFYMHDVVQGPNLTAVRVAPSPDNQALTNSTGSDPFASFFGSVFVMDNPLTAVPDRGSTLVGRAQGIYVHASQQNEFSLLMTLTYMFVSGPYNGSSFSVVGRNPVMGEDRELPIVGGTGMFRLARGYCLLETHSMDGMNAVVGYNATVIHY
ncbi:hypothetical protein Sjap_015168 [Stephania japonica]|uniref:Dirigent protein n=1 Tax=Stephania japonica TaxID=461633 RepID=A0AAP0IK76_9MAGN